MKKFQFRLQKLLWYHQQRQKQAEVRLKQASLQRDAAQSAVTALEDAMQTLCRRPESAGQLVSVAARLALVAHLQVLQRDLTAANEKLKVAEQHVREADLARTQITRDVEGLVQLRAQQLAEYHDEMARQQQILLDEVVMRQWSVRDGDALSSS